MDLKYKLHIPALIAIVVFSITMHFYWTQNIIQNHKTSVIQHQKNILKSIEFELSRYLLGNNISDVNKLLNGLKDIHKERWSNLQLINKQGLRVFPLSHKQNHVLYHENQDIVHLTHAINSEHNKDNTLGTLLVDINWKRYEANQLKRINQLEIYGVVIMLLYFLGSIAWNHVTVVRPIKNIKDAVEGLKSGKNKYVLLAKRNDEFGLLAKEFFNMHEQQEAIQQQLREALTSIWNKEIRHRTVMDNMIEGLVTIDQKGCIESVNKATEKLFGYSAQELMQKNITILMPESVSKYHDSYLEGHNTKKGHYVDLSRQVEGRKKDGSTFPLDISVNEVVIDNRKIFIGILKDITERKFAEESLSQFKTSLDLTKDCVFMFWPDTLSFFYANQGAIEQVGYSTDELMDMKVFDLKPEIDEDDFIKIISPLMQDSKNNNSITFETIHQHKNGGKIPVEILLQFISPANEPSRFIAVVRDITERTASEKEKDHLRSQLQQAQKMESIGQLTGGIAHDFNNMLASIIGYTDLALERFVTDESKLAAYLREVKYAGERGRDLIAQLLAFSRMNTNEPEFLSVSISVQEALNMLRSIIPSNIILHLQHDDNLPKIFMDHTHLNQIIMNLCINARDAITVDRAARIDISINKLELINTKCNSCYEDISGSFVQITISDSGKGMSQEVMTKIFEPFFTTKDVDKGTGMGLSMVHGIIHEHGGHILVESTVNLGTTFKILFPIIDCIKEEAIHTKKLTMDFNVDNSMNSKNVLVVDDEQSVGIFIAELLEMKGYNVTYISDSGQALNIFSDSPDNFDVVITDQTMPGMTGVQLAKKLLELQPELPIILCTGFSANIDEDCAIQHGFKGYLKKPIDTIKLLSLLNELLIRKNIL